MISLIFQALYFFLPAYFANMMPVFAMKMFPRWNYPLDFYKKIDGKRILGSHKTVRGLIIGLLSSMIICLIQWQLYIRYESFQEFSIFPYTFITALSLGYLLGFGALFGDAVKSFIKRRIEVAPGESWMPFDQIDFSIGGLLFSFSYVPSAAVAIIILIASPILSVLTTKIGYALRLRKEKW